MAGDVAEQVDGTMFRRMHRLSERFDWRMRLEDAIGADTSRIVGGRHLYDQVVIMRNISEVIVMKEPDCIIESRTALRTMFVAGTPADAAGARVRVEVA